METQGIYRFEIYFCPDHDVHSGPWAAKSRRHRQSKMWCKRRSACSHIAGNVKGEPLKALHIVFLSTPSSCDHPISTMLVPLFKIPLIATAVGLHYSALKAPNPPPMTGKDRRGFFERTVMYSIPFNVFTQKVRPSS